MANPTAIIDHCLSPTKQWFFALETDKIWRAENIGAIAKPTWQHVMTALDGATFHRMVAPTFGTVYVLATKPGAVNNDAVMYKTVNNGLTWSTHDIASDIGLGAEYKCTDTGLNETYQAQPSSLDHLHTRWDGSESVNPWAMGRMVQDEPSGMWVGWQSDADTIHNNGNGSNLNLLTRPIVYPNSELSVGEIATLTGWVSELLGTEGVDWDLSSPGTTLPLDANRVNVNFYFSHAAGNVKTRSMCWWKYQTAVTATALAYAPSNGSWIYVGFEDQIVMTKNAGVDWEVVTSDYGAYDIAVNPLLAGVITFWTPTGELRQAIAGEVQAAILTETAIQQAHRIAYSRDNGGKLFVLAYNGSTFDLKMYNLASWTTKQSGISGAAGLNTYVKGSGLNYVLYLSGNNIYYSEDDGATVAAKIGDWSGFASPVRIDML